MMFGSKKEWKKKMLDPETWDEEVVLSLASNLELNIIIININPPFLCSVDVFGVV